MHELLGRSFKTTNCLESVNALVEERCAEVDAWKKSKQRHRWLAAALLDVEPRLRQVKGHQHLPKLQAALPRAETGRVINTMEPPIFQLRMGLTDVGSPGTLQDAGVRVLSHTGAETDQIAGYTGPATWS